MRSEKPEDPAKKSAGKKHDPPKDPVYVSVLRAVYEFLIGFFEFFKRMVLEIVSFLAEFFSGLPLLFSYLRKKRAKKRAVKKRRKEAKKEEKRIEKEEESYRKQREKQLSAERKKRSKKERGGRKRRNFAALLLAALVLFEAAIIGLFAGGYLSDKIGSLEKGLTMAVCLDKKNTKETRIPAQYAYARVGGEPCFNMTFMANAFGILTYGNERSILFTFPNGQKLRVSNNSNALQIDDQPFTLKNVVRFYGSSVYMPVEFLVNYVDGLAVSYNVKSRTLTLTLDKSVVTDEEAPLGAQIRLLPSGYVSLPQPHFI